MARLGLVVALIAGIAGASAPAHAFERARPMGLYPAGAGAGASLALIESRIDVTVRGPILETVVVQRFHNASAHAIEATYIFPLPADAAVSAMAIDLGGRTIRGAIEPREAAQRRYEAAVAAGVGAALLEQERADVFTQTVSAIPPGGVVEVTLRYDTVARFEAGAWQLVVPMVVAPRRVPGTASGRATTGSGRAPDTDRAPDASRVTPAASPGAGGSTVVAIHFVDDQAEITSPSHELAGTRREATLSDPHSDHDAIVRWRTTAPSAGWIERDGDGGYAAVVVEAPPAAPRKAQLRVTLALDRAATTRGDGDAVERPLVRALLGALDRPDRVRVIGGATLGWSAASEALAAIERAWATPAAAFDLTRVLAAARPEGAPIVLVSDGLIADDAAAVAAARRLGVPVHVIGIGAAPGRATLQHLAAATGGTVRYASAGDDVLALARAVLADAASPPAPLTISWGTLGASEVEPTALPRLGAGQAMLVVARIRRAQAANARTRGELFAFEALAPARSIDGATTPLGPLARRWARERLGDLLAGPHDRAAVTSHAMRYGLVSPYTSLVAIGTDVVVQGGVRHSVAVPVSLPAGMQWQAVQRAMDLDATGATAPERPADVVSEHAPPVAKRPISEPPATPDAAPDTGKKAGEPSRKDQAPERAPRHSPAEPKDDEDADAAGQPAAPAAPPVTSGLTDAELHELAEREADEELLIVTGRTTGRAYLASLHATAGARRLRLTAALGGGLVLDHGSRGVAALGARLELNRPTAVGLEAALWRVGGGDLEGRALVTIARSGLARWFELGAGLGVHTGDGTGVAAALRLHVDTPLRWLGGFVRYDAAWLLTRPSVEVEHAVTLGLELSY